MFDLYRKWIERCEHRLANRDTNRRVLPFEWGLEWLDAPGETDAAGFVREYSRRAIAGSQDFFAYETPRDYRLDNGCLTFRSPLESPYPENDRVHADYFPAAQAKGRAVVVLPQWNADAQAHVGLCRLLNRFGVSALRMSLAYHDRRMPPGLERADYHVSSNIGRTIHAGRQSVIDTRACLDWLERQGYGRLGVLGTSLGSCIAFITAAHDRRVRAGVFNHVSTYFGDVVWTGLATRFVRQGLEGHVTQDELREYWAPISPATYVGRLAGREVKSLLVWARYDSSFLPELSRKFIRSVRDHGLRHRTFCLPCAHYTTGQFPFNIMDGLAMCLFLRLSL